VNGAVSPACWLALLATAGVGGAFGVLCYLAGRFERWMKPKGGA
jgi:hypothetical protein